MDNVLTLLASFLETPSVASVHGKTRRLLPDPAVRSDWQRRLMCHAARDASCNVNGNKIESYDVTHTSHGLFSAAH